MIYYNPEFDSFTTKKRYNTSFCEACSVFSIFMLFGNLFPAFAFFLDVFHPAFRDELIVCPKAANLM